MKIYPAISQESFTDRLFQIAAIYIHSSLQEHPFQIASSTSLTTSQKQNYHDILHRVPFVPVNSDSETVDTHDPVPPIQVEHIVTFPSHRPLLTQLFSPSDDTFNYLAPRYPDYSRACFLYYSFENAHPLEHLPLNIFVTNVIRRLRASYHENFVLYVYSDDYERCKRQTIFSNAHVQFIEQPETLAFHLMTLCKYGVAVTNEFTWWGAYVHPNPHIKLYFPDTLDSYFIPESKCISITSKKYELLDITFILPLHITDSVDLDNANIQLSYLRQHFYTHIIVWEWGTKSHRDQLDLSQWMDNDESHGSFLYEWLYCEKSIVPRKQIVQMCQYTHIKSEHIALIDWRALLPVSSYLESQRLLSSHHCDVVLPYSAFKGRFSINTLELRDRLDLNFIPSIIPICIAQKGIDHAPEFASSQWATIWRKGAYNWAIKDDGTLFGGDLFEFDDLILQAKYSRLHIYRLKNYVFVLPSSVPDNHMPSSVVSDMQKRALLEKYGIFHVHRIIEETALMHRYNEKNRPRVYFVTFGGGTAMFYKHAMERLTRQARELCIFDKVYGFHNETLKVDPVFWRRQCGFIGENLQGCGLWIWKPYFIRKVLYNMQRGDILMYSDAGNELDLRKRDAILSLFDAVQGEKILGNVVSRRERQCTEIQCTKRDVLEQYFGLRRYDPLLETPQHETNCLVIQKDPKTMALVEEWAIMATEKRHYLDNSPSFLPNYPEFHEHRHDRSLFSLLTKKYNLFGKTRIGDAVDVLRNNSGLTYLGK